MAKKQYVEKNVYELAKERIRHAYELFDTIVVSFSGGKDSTACLNVTLEVARELNKLPLKCVFFDEECIPYQTEEYVRRVYNDPDIELLWLCTPQKARNGASHKEPYMYLWDPNVKEKWVRPLPPEATTDGVLKYSFHKYIAGSLFPPEEYGNVGLILGIRAQESIIRYRSVTAKEHENYIVKYNEPTHKCEKCKGRIPEDMSYYEMKNGKKVYFHQGKCQPSVNYTNMWKVYPVYDWTDDDIWTAPKMFNWDYNKAYDVMEMAGLPRSSQRCSPAFGQEPLEKLWTYKVCFPEIWEKMIYRVKGANTAIRYATTELYAYKAIPDKPKGVKWEEFVARYLNQLSPELKVIMAKRIKSEIKRHYKQTKDPILPKTPHPVTAMSWEFLLKLAMRTDTLNRRQAGSRIDNDKIPELKARWQKEYEKLKEEGELPYL